MSERATAANFHNPFKTHCAILAGHEGRCEEDIAEGGAVRTRSERLPNHLAKGLEKALSVPLSHACALGARTTGAGAAELVF